VPCCLCGRHCYSINNFGGTTFPWGCWQSNLISKLRARYQKVQPVIGYQMNSRIASRTGRFGIQNAVPIDFGPLGS